MRKTRGVLTRIALVGGVIVLGSWAGGLAFDLEPWRAALAVAPGVLLTWLGSRALRRRREDEDAVAWAGLVKRRGEEARAPVVFCAGLPYAGERPLTPGERAELRRVARWLVGLGCLFQLLVPVAMLALPIVGMRLTQRDAESLSGVLILVGFTLGGLTLAAVLLLQGRDRLRRGIHLRQLRKADRVQRFEGPLQGWVDPSDVSLRTLLEMGLLDPENEEPVVLELLSDRDELYSVNGVRVWKKVPIGVTRAARAPAESIVLDVPADWAEGAEQPDLWRRRPSQEELDEIAGYARVDWRTLLRILPAAVLVPWVMLGPLLSAFNVPWRIAVWVVVATEAAFVAVLAYLDSADRRRLRADADFGWVLVVPTTTVPASEEEEPGPGPVVEVLPVTERVWTIDGKPAAWRRETREPRG